VHRPARQFTPPQEPNFRTDTRAGKIRSGRGNGAAERIVAAETSSKTVVYAALIGNLLVALSKGAAAAVTGSSAMLSEAVHSLVDTGNEVLLLYGLHRAAQTPDREHPLGYGRELYFWSFIVALLVFALGAGVSVYEGILHIRNPEPITQPLINYAVLGAALLFEGVSWLISLRQFRAAKGPLGYYQAFRRSKDPPSFMVLFEDSAALLGILIAGFGTFASVNLGMPALDGIASILIGAVLALVAVLLARESKSLLIGERADKRLNDSILKIAGAEDRVARANGVLTVQLAPEQVVAALSLDFADELKADDIEEKVDEIERKVRAAHPEVVALFVKPQADKSYREAIRRRYGEPG
jgi:cation diffusion facilitator family transporter